MLVDIVKMPPVFGIPIDRRVTLCIGDKTETWVPDPVIHWPMCRGSNRSLSLGSRIDRTPAETYKSIHISHDHSTVFETVFSKEGDRFLCLYTRIISSSHIDIGISLEAIRYYQSGRTHLLPLSDFFLSPQNSIDQYGRTEIVIGTDRSKVAKIVPPVFTEGGLSQQVNRFMDIMDQDTSRYTLGCLWEPLNEYEPSLLYALTEGYYWRSPFFETRQYYPTLRLGHDRWSKQQQVSLMVAARGCQVYVNSPEFDYVAALLMTTGPAKVSIACLMSHALDGISDVWTVREYDDPYRPVFFRMGMTERRFDDALVNIFHYAALAYCRMFKIDSVEFLSTTKDLSQITIEKNMYDEISITVHDMILDNYVCFYTSFPALALSTLSVGWYN